MFTKIVVLIALVGYASAVCQCSGKATTQKEIWSNSSIGKLISGIFVGKIWVIRVRKAVYFLVSKGNFRCF
jgi:hypothetical protein